MSNQETHPRIRFYPSNASRKHKLKSHNPKDHTWTSYFKRQVSPSKEAKSVISAGQLRSMHTYTQTDHRKKQLQNP